MKVRSPSNKISEKGRIFGDPAAYLNEVGPGGVAQLLKNGADITLVVSEDGRIEDVAYRDPEFNAFGASNWAGCLWSDVVTSESVEKITAMLDNIDSGQPSAARQVNHPGRNGPDLPVRYRLVRPKDSKILFAFGENLSDVANAQSRLVQAQMELEADYRRLRETEARYRTVFQMSGRAILVVEGASRTIMDANQAAVTLFGKEAAKLAGEPVTTLLDRAARKNGATQMTEAHYQGSSRIFRAPIANGNGECIISVVPFRENGQNNLLVTFDTAEDGMVSLGAPVASDLPPLGNHPEGAVLLDTRGQVVAVNEQFLDLVQALSKDRIVGRPLNNWLGASPVDMQVLLTKLKKEERVSGFATVARHETSGTTDVMVSASATVAHGEPRFLLIISEDIRRSAPLSPPSYGSDTGPGGISELVGRVPMKELIRDSVDVIEKMCIEAALNQTGNNRASAADLLGLSRQSLYIKLKKYGLEDFGDV